MIRNLYIFNHYAVRTVINNFTLTEQRIWDIMMLFAHENLMTIQCHKISLETLSNYLANKNHAAILSKLNDMKKDLIFNSSNKQETFGHYFENIKTVDNEIFYEYPYHLRVLFATKIEIDFLKKVTAIHFESRYSIFLYRFFYMANLLGYIKIMPLFVLRCFLDIKPNQYADPKYFFTKVLVKGMHEINTKTDLIVNLKPFKVGKAIVAFEPTMKYKNENIVEAFSTKDLLNFVLQNVAFFKAFYISGKIPMTIDSDFVDRHISQEDKKFITKLILDARKQRAAQIHTKHSASLDMTQI